MDLTRLLALLGGTAAVVVGISVWLSSLATNRLLSRWRRQENALLEDLRAANAHSAALLGAGVRGFGAGHDMTLQKRVAAAEELWRHGLALRERYGRAVFFFGILQSNEYGNAIRKNATIAESVADLNDETITDGISTTESLELHSCPLDAE